MGDGNGKAWKGLYLCTDSFSNYDIVRLMNVLLIRYNINSSLVQTSGKSRIYIASPYGTESIKITNLVSVPEALFTQVCYIRYQVTTL